MSYTGAAAAGFCALSDAVSVMGREGCHFEVGEAPPVVHAACVLKRSKNREAARLFVKFLQSPEAENNQTRNTGTGKWIGSLFTCR